MNEWINIINDWATSYAGVISLSALIAALISIYIAVRTSRKRLKLEIDVKKEVTMCVKSKAKDAGEYEEAFEEQEQDQLYHTAISIQLSIKNRGNSHLFIEDMRLDYRTNVLKWEAITVSDNDRFIKRWIKLFFKYISQKQWDKRSHLQDKFRFWHRLYRWYNYKHFHLHGFNNKWMIDQENGYMATYPMFFQSSDDPKKRTYDVIKQDIVRIEIKEKIIGVVYFESRPYWGGYEPLVRNNAVRVRLFVMDSDGKKFTKRLKIPFVDLDHARKFYPWFGNQIENPKHVLFN